jgi:hypothetical protein
MPGEQTLLRAAMLAGTLSSSQRAFHSSLLAAADPPAASLSLSGILPGVTMAIPREWTVAEGLTGSAGAGLGGAVSGGLYVWFKRPGSEIGLFGSLSLGLITNLSVGAGLVCMVLFGPAPSMLGGDSVTVSIDIGIEFVTISGFLILSAPPGGLGALHTMPATAMRIAGGAWPGGWRPQLIGIGFSITAGFSALPVNMTVMPGRTWIRPVLSSAP